MSAIPPLSLRSLLIIYCTVVTLLLTAALLLFHSRIFEQYAIERLTAHGKAVAANTAFLVAGEMVSHNYAFLQQFSEEFSARPEISGVLISDEEWRLVAAPDQQMFGREMEQALPGESLFRDDDFCVRLDHQGGQLIVTSPVTIGQRLLGRVRVSLPTAEMMANLQTLQRQGLLIGLGFWLLAMLGGYLLAHRLSEPMQRFMQATDQIRQGDFKIAIPAAGPVRELNNYGNALGLMAAAIAQREQEVARMRNYLQNIFESMPSLLVAVDGDGKITQWNSAAGHYTGIAAGEAVGRELYAVAPFLIPFADQMAETIRHGDPVSLHRQQLALKGAAKSHFDLTIFPLRANGVEGVVVRLDDISELEKKEQQLRQAQKMETVGTLAGGLAHDFNNVLTGILGNVSLLRYKQSKGLTIEADELQECLEQINAAGSRAADMVRQLLTLSRRHKSEQLAVDLQLSIKHVRKLCESTFDRAVRVVVRDPEAAEPALVLADPTEVEQVLLNLCVNAMHAMTIMRQNGNWGGTLLITLEQVRVDDNFRRSHPEARAAEYWRLAVNDSGVGIAPENRERIFQPFFTTKEQEKGTGLGLAMVYSIVKHHGGFVGVYSEPGLGSTFSVYLPLLQRSTTAAAVAGSAVPEQRGSGLILVVDDDQIVRKLAGEALQLLGYQVLYAVNGREAVELYRQRHPEIAGVLLDMVMPVLSGREAFFALREINPAVVVVLTSGFRQDERVDEVMRHGAGLFLQKPYDLQALALAMEQALRA